MPAAFVQTEGGYGAGLEARRVQVNKAKELQTRLQGVSRSSQQYQSLRSEVEDECKSISWQVWR